MFQSFIDYFRHVDVWQVLDLVIVLLLVVQLYRSVKGSIASNIFIGALIIYLLWVLVRQLELPLLSEILNRLVSIGLIGLIVLFQPELRKFLINLGRRSSFLGKNGIFKGFASRSVKRFIAEEEVIQETIEALHQLIDRKMGAFIIVAKNDKYQFDTNTGVLINGLVSSELIVSIFSNQSPLKEGALLIDNNMIVAARIRSSISNNEKISSFLGLRHRAALGATERSEVISIVVSEERQTLAVAKEGLLYENLSMEQVKKEMYNALIH